MEPFHLSIESLPDALRARISTFGDPDGATLLVTERGLIYQGLPMVQVGARMGRKPGLRFALESNAVLDARRVTVYQYLLRVLASLLGDVERYEAVILVRDERCLWVMRVTEKGRMITMGAWNFRLDGAVVQGAKARPCPALAYEFGSPDFLPIALCRLLDTHADLAAVRQPATTSSSQE